MRGLIGVLFTGVVALVAGAIGFQAGIASNIGAAGGAVYLGGGMLPASASCSSCSSSASCCSPSAGASAPGPAARWAAGPLGRSRPLGHRQRSRAAHGWPMPTNLRGGGCGRRDSRHPRNDGHRLPHRPPRGRLTTLPYAGRVSSPGVQPVPGAPCAPSSSSTTSPHRRLVRDYLEHAGFDVMTAGDGTTALATFRARPPDVLVLDLGLPRMDGLDVLRAIRRDCPRSRS